MCLAGLPQRIQIARVLVMDSASCKQVGHRRKRPPHVVGIQAGDDHLLPASANWFATSTSSAPKKFASSTPTTCVRESSFWTISSGEFTG